MFIKAEKKIYKIYHPFMPKILRKKIETYKISLNLIKGVNNKMTTNNIHNGKDSVISS